MSEVTVLDLDWDLIGHLVDVDSYQYLITEQFSPDLIEDELALKVWFFQERHRRKNGEIAGASVIEDEFEEVTVSDRQTSIAELVERMRKRYIRNSGQTVMEKLAKQTVDDPLTVGKEMLIEGRKLIQITETRGESFGPDDHERAVRAYDLTMTHGMGPSFGYDQIDRHFHGQRGVSVLLASPKSYKSWLTINAVDANIVPNCFPYLYSLELPAVDSFWRLKCMQANIPYWKYLHGSLDAADIKALEDIAEDIQGGGQFRVEKPEVGQRSPAHLVEKAVNAGATCVFVDQLQYVETNKGVSLGALNKTGDYFDVLNDFRNYSDDIPIFLVHQFNRTVMGMDGMPEMQQAKGSSAIEEVASQALAAWATKDMRKSGLLYLGTNFSRHHSHAQWEIGVELNKGCKFTNHGLVDDE